MCNSLASCAKNCLSSALVGMAAQLRPARPSLSEADSVCTLVLQAVRGLIFKANLNWHIIPGTNFFFFNQQLCLLVSLSPPVWIRQVVVGSTVTVSQPTSNGRLWWPHCLWPAVIMFCPALVAALLTPALYPLCLSPTDFSVQSFFVSLAMEAVDL